VTTNPTIEILENISKNIPGFDLKFLLTYGWLPSIILTVSYFIKIISDAGTKKYGTSFVDNYINNNQSSYSSHKNWKKLDSWLFDKKDVSFDLLANSQADSNLNYNPEKLIYSARVEIARVGIINLNCPHFLSTDAFNITASVTDSELINNMLIAGSKVILDEYNYLPFDSESKCIFTPEYYRFRRIFDINNFGDICNYSIKGGIAYVLMIASGASVGGKYKNRAYFDCIQIIAKGIADNQEFLKLTDDEAIEKLIRLVGLLLSNESDIELLNLSIRTFLFLTNPNESEKLTFDQVRIKCYEVISSLGEYNGN
jgi:hypothetical protein